MEDRLQTLTEKMLKQEGKAPKLRGSAAVVRALVPFARELADELLDRSNPVEDAARCGIYHLHQCYLALSSTAIFAEGVMNQSTKFALQYVALEIAHEGSR